MGPLAQPCPCLILAAFWQLSENEFSCQLALMRAKRWAISLLTPATKQGVNPPARNLAKWSRPTEKNRHNSDANRLR